MDHHSLIATLNALHDRVENEIKKDTYYSTDPQPNCPNIKLTPYPEIIKHFTYLAQGLAKSPEMINEKIIESSKKLEDVLNQKPMSEKLRASICIAMGAISGFVIGVTIIAADSVATGGIGTLPSILVAASLGLSVAGAVTGSLYGFFNAKNKLRIQQQREKEYGDGNLVHKPDSYIASEIAHNALHELSKLTKRR